MKFSLVITNPCSLSTQMVSLVPQQWCRSCMRTVALGIDGPYQLLNYNVNPSYWLDQILSIMQGSTNFVIWTKIFDHVLNLTK